MLLLLILIVIFLFAMTGFHRGGVASALHLGSTFFSLWVASRFYQPLSDYSKLFIPYPRTRAYETDFVVALDHHEARFNHIVVFLLIVIVIKTMMYLVINSFDQLFETQRMAMFNRLTGAFVACCSAFICLHYICFLFALFPDATLQNALAHSMTGQWFVTEVPLLSEFTLNLK